MESLYNRIYNAVNEGIQKALLIDPDQNDVSINYSYHKIDNTVMDNNKFNKLATEFIENLTLKKYNALLNYSLNGIYQYKVKNFYELSHICDKISELTDNIDLSWINTANIITFIMNNGNELFLEEINDSNEKDIVFVKFNIKFKRPVIIYKNLLLSANAWCLKTPEIFNDNNKDNGYKNTKIIKENKLINLDNYPAFKYCINIKDEYPELKNFNYEAYLPAINELKFLNSHINLINYILTYINGKELPINSWWWSSSQYFTQWDVTAAYYLQNGYSCIPNHNYVINKEMLILPLFAKIN